MRKRLFILSALLLMVCGQMWANYGNGKPDWGTRCNGNSPTTVIVDGVMYSLYSNQNYTYTHYTNNEDGYTYSTSTSESGNYAVAVYAEEDDSRSELTIRSTIQEGNTTYTVVAVGEQFFWYNKTATKLTIPATVQTLEGYALEDNKINLSEIVIEDSENSLECYRTTGYWGAFYWNSGLKKVYIGRDLYTMGDEAYFAPFYKLNTNATFDLTIGPNVTTIPEYCFGNCDDIKSIKAMPQNPPYCGTKAFYGVTNSIPVYVSYKTKNAYTSASGWSNFTNYVLDIDLCKADAIAELTKAKEDNPSGAANKIFDTYKTRIEAATSTDEVIAAKEEGIMELQKYVEELECAKASAEAELDAAKIQYPSEYADDIVNNCKKEIEAATTIEDVKNAKDEGIKNLQLEYNNLLSIKSQAISELDNAKEQYPSANASSIVAEGKDAIQNAKSQSEVINKKEYYIAQLMTAFEAANAKNDAINALNQAKEDYPSDAAEGIVSTYTGKINDATTKDAITAAKEEGIQALKDAYNAQKEAERLAALDAVTVTQTAEDDYSYMLEDGVRFTFDGDNVYTTVNGQDKPGFTLSETVAIRICPARTFKLKANQNPDKPTDFYSTFYTSEGAYKVPSEAKAYAGEVETGEEADVLKMTDVGSIIHKKEAVILRANQSEITLMPSCNKDSTSTKNALEGTDKGKTLTTNQYALSLGQNGVGFYLWEGKSIGAHKAYLTLDGVAHAKAFTFMFEDGTTTAIEPPTVNCQQSGDAYNLNGIRVKGNYKGIVIKNGKKIYQK